MNIVPEDVVKFSGIGCSSKSPTYFLNRSFGFNGLHGRMPPVATGALFGDHRLKGIGLSGDGDSASIGMGQFKHIVRRNVDMLYIVENNGVYGLTKGQFSATAEVGLSLKHQGTNPYMPVDICLEALASNATFVARSFAGNPKQVKELLKAALSHNGIGIGTDGVGTVTVTSSYNLVTDNSTSGLYQGGVAVHESQGNNTVRQNGANTTGIHTGVAGV
jgi:2-oxoglutarate ferredoxin oxidoreductase subunit beta